MYDVLRSPAKPLDADVRMAMGLRFGQDLSSVRVHTDTTAAESARAIGALAYTAGRHVVFGSGRYEPRSTSGRKLTAHELAHVIQQANAELDNHTLRLDSPQSHEERVAEDVSNDPLRQKVVAASVSGPARIQRQPLPQPATPELSLLQPPSETVAALSTTKIGTVPSTANLIGAWNVDFVIGLAVALKADVQLQLAFDDFGKQLAAPGGKAAFAGGLAIGLPAGAVGWAMNQMTSLLQIAVNTPRGDAVNALVLEFAKGILELAFLMREFGPYAIEHPREMGELAAAFGSEKIRNDLFLQSPLETEMKLKEAAKGSPSLIGALGIKDAQIELPKASSLLLDKLTTGKVDQKGKSVWNKGVAIGMMLGASLVEVAAAVLAPEDLAVAFESQLAKVRSLFKQSGIAKEISALARRVQNRVVTAGAREMIGLERGAPGITRAPQIPPEVAAMVDRSHGGATVASDASTVGGKRISTSPLVKAGGTAATSSARPMAQPLVGANSSATGGSTPVSHRVLSHGELQEPRTKALYHPEAKALSEKSAGFDFVEGQQSVGATVETKKGLAVAEERIAGGTWIQLKSINGIEEHHAVRNAKVAMERAANALGGVPRNELKPVGGTAGRKIYERADETLGLGRANQVEGTEQGKAYRTSYARQPDQITIHLHFENVAATDKVALSKLDLAARAEVASSPYAIDLPPVKVMVTGGK